jgi:hypothetical protein
MSDAFDWRNTKSQINWKSLERSRKSSYQMSRHVNEQRKKGIEPSASCATRPDAYLGGLPKDYTTEMPEMPLHKRSLNRKAKK